MTEFMHVVLEDVKDGQELEGEDEKSTCQQPKVHENVVHNWDEEKLKFEA